MTIIDQLLILLDDLGEVRPEDLSHYFPNQNRQVIFSALGRLVNRGWIAKKTKRLDISYTITTPGVNELNRTLDSIKQEDEIEWDRQWHLVIFDIPETKRKLRDMLRNFLREEGFGLLKSSVWLTPWDKKEIVKRFGKRHSLIDSLVFIDTAPTTDSYQSIVMAQQSWDWLSIEKAYRHFLTLADKQLSQLNQHPYPRFLAKQLVFQYAEVMKKDPQLPTDIAPNASLWRRARELYTRIRPYCLID